MQKSRFLLVIALSFAWALLFTGVYLFASSNANFAQAQMMPTVMPTTPQTATPTPNNNQTITTLLIAITVVAIALIAALLILIYFRKQRRKAEPQSIPQVYTSKSTQTPPLTPQISSKEESKPFEVFLCYKKSSGKDYADHLKAGLEEVGLHTFEDCKDIPLAVDSEKCWSGFRDKALTESKYFILIMTPGFDLSSEVVKELALARKQSNKTFVFFRHRSMGRKIRVDLGGEVLDIGQLEQVSFESKEELLRLAINILQKGSAH